MILEDGTVLARDAEEIVAELDRLYPEPDGAAAHYDDPAGVTVGGE